LRYKKNQLKEISHQSTYKKSQTQTKLKNYAVFEYPHLDYFCLLSVDIYDKTCPIFSSIKD